LNTIKHKEPDRVPMDAWFTPPILKRLCDDLGVKDEVQVKRKLKHDILTFQMNVTASTYKKSFLSDGSYFDEFGIHWPATDFQDVMMPLEHPLKAEEDIDHLTFPDPHESWRYAELTNMVEKYGEEFAIFAGIGFTIFERAWSMRGLTRTMRDIVGNSAMMHRLLDKITEYDIEVAKEIVRYDIDCFYCGDDYAMQTGPFISPTKWRQLIKPRLDRIFEIPRGRNLPISLHSCGNIMAIIPDLIDVGVNVINPAQASAIDVNLVKRMYGKEICLWGSLDTQHTLPFGTVDEVKAEVKDRIKKLAPGGGLILAPVHTVLPDVPLGNIYAFVEAVEEYGKYPISLS